MFAYEAIDKLYEILRKVKIVLNPNVEIVGILPTMVNTTKVSKEVIQLLNDNYSKDLFNTIIPASTEASKSARNRKSLCLDNSKLGNAYRELAKELIKLYFGEHLEDMVESIRQNGILNPILVQLISSGKYEILSGHNMVKGAKIIGLKHLPAIIKKNLSEDEAEIYVIEINLIQCDFNDLLISEQAHVLKIQHSKMFSQGKRNDIIAELECLESGSTSSQIRKKLSGNTSLSKIGDEYGMSKNTVARLLRINYLI